MDTRNFNHKVTACAMSISIGDEIPDFKLLNANKALGGDYVSSSDYIGENGLIIVFECNHCPYVIASIERINQLSKFANSNSIGFIGINSNDAKVYASDSFENMIKRAEKGMPYPYLFDETQEIAHKFGAKRTPEFFLFDSNRELVYSGRMDDSPRDPNQVSSNELRDAIESLLNGEKPQIEFTESIGCSVKWKV